MYIRTSKIWVNPIIIYLPIFPTCLPTYNNTQTREILEDGNEKVKIAISGSRRLRIFGPDVDSTRLPLLFLMKMNRFQMKKHFSPSRLLPSDTVQPSVDFTISVPRQFSGRTMDSIYMHACIVAHMYSYM